MSVLTEEHKAELQAEMDAMIAESVEKAGLKEVIRRFTPGGDGGEQSIVKPFKTLGEQLVAVVKSEEKGMAPDPRLLAIHKATGLGEGIAADGGFLIQPDFAAELLRRTYEIGAIVSRCRRIPVTGNALKINAIAETARTTGNRWGGITGYWAAEAGTKTPTMPQLRQMNMELKKLVALCYATDELLQDAAALGALLQEGFAEEIAFLTEDAVVNGLGAGQPLGILASPCLVTVAKEAGQPAATILYQNIVKMWSRMWARSRANSVWFINQDIEPQLFQLALSVGTGGAPAYMPANGLSQSPYGTLMGRPVVPVEYCATLGTVGDIILADFSQYLLIDKGPIQAAQSIHVRFVYDETAFRFTYRVDGQPAWNAPLMPYKGSNTLSPFVVLATRA